MITQEMFAQEQVIRDLLGRLRNTILGEQERYQGYAAKPGINASVLRAWRDRITVYTEASNLLADYLSDYTVSQHGVLKYLRQAESERDVAKQNLLYLNELYTAQMKRQAAIEAEKLAYSLMGKEVERIEPELNRIWSQALDEELAIYEKMIAERGCGHAA